MDHTVSKKRKSRDRRFDPNYIFVFVDKCKLKAFLRFPVSLSEYKYRKKTEPFVLCSKRLCFL